jgi:hypothetical protein
MATWAWFAIAAGTGAFVGIESWAWLRHGTSAVALALIGSVALIQALVVVVVVGAIGLGLLAGVTGWDPARLNDSTAADGAAARSDCDPSYPDDCLDPNSADYDCDRGSGDGPRYVTGPVSVPGADPYDLDRDGDGIGCD